MTERSIHLNVQSGASRMDLSDTSAQGNGADQRQADPAAVDQFRAALAGARAALPPSNPSPSPSPFSLFGAVNQASTEPVGAPPVDVDFDAIALTASRLMVSADGRRAVRMDIDATVLPGVTVSVFEEGGLLTVVMEAATQEGIDRLLQEGRRGCDAIATRLQRDVYLELREANVATPVGSWRGQIN
jgi:hypothetical protein